MKDGMDAGTSGRDGTERLLRGLGWFSIGAGLPAVLAPGTAARAMGVGDGELARRATRVLGVRDVLNGAGILGRPRPAGFLLLRMAGDVLDITLLTASMLRRGAPRTRLAATAASVAGVAVVDVVAARRLALEQRAGVRWCARASVAVGAPRDEVYRFWRRFENLPSFMPHLVRVTQSGARSHWVAGAGGGRSFEWDAGLVIDRPNEMISWRSLSSSVVDHRMTVALSDAPGGGTEVLVELDYETPTGALGRTVAKALGERPQRRIEDDLRRFRQVVETADAGRPEGDRWQAPERSIGRGSAAGTADEAEALRPAA
jgi:uncharacterized membrane protein